MNPYIKKHCRKACPPTLLVRSGWDFHGVGQRTGDQNRPVKVHHGFADEMAENTPQPIRGPQSGVGGDVDVDLKKECRKRRGGINGDTQEQQREEDVEGRAE